LIIVGIGFPNISTNYDTILSKVADLRTRDMTPYQVDSLDTPSMRVRGVKTGGADKFFRLFLVPWCTTASLFGGMFTLPPTKRGKVRHWQRRQPNMFTVATKSL
jgi:hypothetical protein